MSEENPNCTHNVVSGTSEHTVQVGAVHGNLTIGRAGETARTRRVVVFGAPIAAAVLALCLSDAPAPGQRAEVAPAIVPQVPAPAPERMEVGSSGTGHGDTELSSRSDAPGGPSSGAQCQGTGENTRCEVSSSLTYTPLGPQP
ncbi:hypothetical protein OOZ19_09440 [Saccharopolyspora sp. NFXS83]|uniref:hypothetical protein n=1 Tax=Saccharopolyspora sp. NFXS83 TaxID=2993560 RepID=UPI00224A862C|nr:hypothetical protein [Saccharopolyspora sp. NFXS83]MCX2730464.1 hypothetical protein [Saccharopolyspora sp. NFXS83]